MRGYMSIVLWLMAIFVSSYVSFLSGAHKSGALIHGTTERDHHPAAQAGANCHQETAMAESASQELAEAQRSAAAALKELEKEKKANSNCEKQVAALQKSPVVHTKAAAQQLGSGKPGTVIAGSGFGMVQRVDSFEFHKELLGNLPRILGNLPPPLGNLPRPSRQLAEAKLSLADDPQWAGLFFRA